MISGFYALILGSQLKLHYDNINLCPIYSGPLNDCVYHRYYKSTVCKTTLVGCCSVASTHPSPTNPHQAGAMYCILATMHHMEYIQCMRWFNACDHL